MSSSFCFVLNRVPNKSIYNVTSKYCTKGIVLLYNKYRSQNNSAVIPRWGYSYPYTRSIYQSDLPEHMAAPFTCRPNLLSHKCTCIPASATPDLLFYSYITKLPPCSIHTSETDPISALYAFSSTSTLQPYDSQATVTM